VSIAGKWRTIEMEVWDQDAFDLLGPAFFSFDGKRSGSFRFIAVEGGDGLPSRGARRTALRGVHLGR
jgi:hypothetical protein